MDKFDKKDIIMHIDSLDIPIYKPLYYRIAEIKHSNIEDINIDKIDNNIINKYIYDNYKMGNNVDVNIDDFTNLQNRINSIYLENHNILAFYKLSLPTDMEIKYIILSVWEKAILLLIDKKYITVDNLIDLIIDIYKDDNEYFNIVIDDYYKLFKNVNISNRYQYRKIKSILPNLFLDINKHIIMLIGGLNEMQLGYILGIDIIDNIPTMNQCIYELINNMIDNIEYKNIYNYINTKDSLYNKLYKYNKFDIITINKYAFSRAEFKFLLDTKKNFYTRMEIDKHILLDIENRLKIVDIYNIPEMINKKNLIKKMLDYLSDPIKNDK